MRARPLLLVVSKGAADLIGAMATKFVATCVAVRGVCRRWPLEFSGASDFSGDLWWRGAPRWVTGLEGGADSVVGDAANLEGDAFGAFGEVVGGLGRASPAEGPTRPTWLFDGGEALCAAFHAADALGEFDD